MVPSRSISASSARAVLLPLLASCQAPYPVVAPSARSHGEIEAETPGDRAPEPASQPLDEGDLPEQHPYRDSHPKSTLFGRSSCALGDLDDDGTTDFAVGAPMAWSHGERTGSVLVFSGRGPEVLFRVDGDGHGAGFGEDVVAVDDLDGDGKPELAIGSMDTGREVRVLSPARSATLFSIPGFSRCLGTYGDLDRDGIRDLLLERDFMPAEDRTWGQGHAHRVVCSGRDGSRLAEAPGWGTLPALAIGDVDGDEICDFVREPEAGDRELLVCSGADGSRLLRLDLPEGVRSRRQFEVRCAVGEIGLGRGLGFLLSASELEQRPGNLRLYSLENGEHLRVIRMQTAPPEREDWLSYSVFAPGDLDGDGIGDFVVARLLTFDTWLAAYSGSGWRQLWSIPHVVDWEAEVRLDPLADRNGDGAADLLVSSVGYLHGFGPPQYVDNGTALVLSGKDGQILHRLNEADFSQLRR